MGTEPSPGPRPGCSRRNHFRGECREDSPPSTPRETAGRRRLEFNLHPHSLSVSQDDGIWSFPTELVQAGSSWIAAATFLNPFLSTWLIESTGVELAPPLNPLLSSCPVWKCGRDMGSGGTSDTGSAGPMSQQWDGNDSQDPARTAPSPGLVPKAELCKLQRPLHSKKIL